jgi:serine/threonine protein kinase
MSVQVSTSTLRGEGAADPQRGAASFLPPRYRLLRKLGVGGMAEVHLAAMREASGRERRVAIKLVRQDKPRSPLFVELLATEAQLASRLNHPNIVRVLDFDSDLQARPFLVMEYVSGVDLAVALHHAEPLPIAVAAFIAAEVLRGLAYAHELPREIGLRGLIHRDISPQNLLLSWEGEVKIADFGISKELLRSSVSGEVVGKPGYMSPEQVRGDRLDPRSDLFSLGVILWEMLAGCRLFGRGRSKEILGQITSGNVPPPSQARSEVPEDLEHVAMKLLEVELPQRYACADDALQELLRCACMAPDGAEELRAALRARFHQPARGSDGISALRERSREFDLAEVPSTNLTVTAQITSLEVTSLAVTRVAFTPPPETSAPTSPTSPPDAAAQVASPGPAVAVAPTPASAWSGKRRVALALGLVAALSLGCAIALALAMGASGAREPAPPPPRASSSTNPSATCADVPSIVPSADPTEARPATTPATEERERKPARRAAPRSRSGMVQIDLGGEASRSRPSSKE